MKKSLVVILIFVVGVIGMVLGVRSFRSNHTERPIWKRNISLGYGPYKFSAHKGWAPDKKYDYVVLRRKISIDLPESNFNLQVQKVAQVTHGKQVTLDDYVNNYLLRELKEIHKADIISVNNFSVDAFTAKDILFTYDLTIQGLTRQIKNRIIVFIAGDYVYSFNLGSFEKDFDVASKEFEMMVNSFHFVTTS